jgi:drug/metabolite transporter (DMT)-like permease
MRFFKYFNLKMPMNIAPLISWQSGILWHMPRSSSRHVAYGFLFASMALVGSYVALAKPLTAVLPVFVLALLRFGIAAVAMVPWLARAQAEAALSRADKWRLFWQSFFGNFLFSICMLYGVMLSSATAAGIIMSLIPAAVALLSWLFLRDAPTPRVWLALGLAVATILIINLAKVQDASVPRSALWGNALLAAAMLCEAIYVVIGKRLSEQVSAKRVSALINLVGLCLILPLGLWQATHVDFAAVNAGTWLLLLFYALAASQWSVWLWMTGLKHVPASQAGVFTVALPLSATLIGVLFLNETFTWMHAVAFACAVAGVLLMARAPQPRH